MIETNRVPSVGKAWLAWHAIQRGDEPEECVVDFIDDAKARLDQMLSQRSSMLEGEDRELLSDISFVFIALSAALRAKKGFAKKVVWKNRAPGKPKDKLERAKKEYAAVAIVERMIGEGFQEEQSIQQAVVETGVSRSEIFARWRYIKAWRDPAQREELIAKMGDPPGFEALIAPLISRR